MPWADSHGATPPKYWAVRIEQEPEQLEATAAWLLDFGLSGVQFEDGRAVTPCFGDDQWMPSEPPHVTAYFADDERWPSVAAAIAQKSQRQGFTLKISSILSEDWQNGWKAYYQPIALRYGYGIVPAWLTSPFAPAKTIRLDPGMAFGTGTHPTTKSCLDMLLEQGASKPRVLDLGSGSGILALAAAKLGAGQVDAVEPDPVAVRALRHNLELNQWAERVQVIPGTLDDLPDGEPYDMVLMNLIRDLIVELWPRVRPRVRGMAILSGILEDACSEIEDVVRESGMQVLQYQFVRGWVTLRVGA